MIIHLAKESDLLVNNLPVDYYVDKIRKREYFSFIKQNITFWEMLLKEPKALSMYNSLHDRELVEQTFNIVHTVDRTNMILAVSNLGPPTDFSENHNPTEQEIKIANKIKAVLPPNYIPHLACIWKIYMLDGTIRKFFDAIKEKKYEVIVVGLQHLTELNDTLNFKVEHYKLTLESSQKNHRHTVLDNLLAIANRSDHPKIFLFQAGGCFSTWLIYHMNQKTTNCFLIDMGRSLDLLCPNRKLSEVDAKINPFDDFQDQQWLKVKVKKPQRIIKHL